MDFLKARWEQLAIVNYSIDPEILKPYLPAHTELDIWNGHCFVSLVGFMFLNTRVMGVPIPFYQNFEEVNLRFYVKREDESGTKRGVVFIKEIVPKYAISMVANSVYQENYVTRRMNHDWQINADQREIRYAWRDQGKEHFFQLRADNQSFLSLQGSEEEFITEHYWGYTRLDDQRSLEYEVKHPQWECYKVLGADIQLQFGQNYGQSFSFLDNMQQQSVMLVKGSVISVGKKRRIDRVSKLSISEVKLSLLTRVIK